MTVMLPSQSDLRCITSSPGADENRLLRASGESLRVLLVEDDAMVAQALRDIIEECGGYVAGMITSGLASIGAASGTRPDVIVMDVGLPGMDGIDAAAIIRARSSIPIVFVSGRDMSEEVAKRAGKLNRIEMLLKPITQATLCDAIHRVLSQSE
jgi:CheY-like chemotaxis protein